MSKLGLQPVRMMVRQGKHLKLRLWIAARLIRWAYKIGGIRFEETVQNRPERRRDRRGRWRSQ